MNINNTDEQKIKITKLFEAFFPFTGDTPKIRWKNKDTHMTWEEIQKYNLPGVAGLIREGIVVVDVDEQNAAEKILHIIEKEKTQCRVHRTTRGIHIFFRAGENDIVHTNKQKQRATNLIPLCGLGVDDEKRGHVDYFSEGLIFLKKNNIWREVIYETDTLGNIPPWLQPIGKRAEECTKNYIRLNKLKEGEGRNSALFTAQNLAIKMGLTHNDWMICAKIINDYIFAELLENEEWNTVTRQESYKSIPSTKKIERREETSTIANEEDWFEQFIYNLARPHPKREREYCPDYAACGKILGEHFNVTAVGTYKQNEWYIYNYKEKKIRTQRENINK